MPIVTVEIVVDADDALESGLAQSLANTIGGALDSPPGQTWVRVYSIPHGQYAENDCDVDANDLPVFVTVLKRQSPVVSELQSEIALLTEAIARAVGRTAANVHIEYAPAATNRLALGGKLVQ